MKNKLALFLSTASLLHAGSPDLETPLAAKPEPWIKPTIDIRARYENADIDTKDTSNAFTTRERLGLKTTKWNGFSALIEGEFTQVVNDEYNGGAIGANPFDPAKTLIADPETNELNQGYLQYEGFDTSAKAGRQKIIYDNAAFIGNVGWRQNEQTYDAISFTNKSVDHLTFSYAYVNQVNRIFGSFADAPLVNAPPVIYDNVQYIDTNTNLINASYDGIKGVTLGGYAYLMQFEDKENWDNNTFGMSAKGNLWDIAFYGELAIQDQAGPNADETAYYAHGTATKTFGKQTLALSVEELGAGFKTPFATVHAFNGYADAFVTGRVEGNHNGLTDVSAAYTIPVFFDIKWTNVLHAFGDNEISTGYGWEYDSVLVKKFNDNFTALAKVAVFDAGDDALIDKQYNPAQVGLLDTTRFSIELDYTF
jgi:hypothetical protein